MEALQTGRGVAAPSEEPPYRRFVYSVWLRVGFAGASLVAGGLADYSLLKSQGHLTDALTAVAAGAVLLAIAWRKGRAALAQMSATLPEPPNTNPAASPGPLPGWLRGPALRTQRH